MEKIWYLFLDNHHKGPFSSEEIFKMFHSDQIHEKSLVWREGMPKWALLNETEELWSSIAPLAAPPALPIEELPFHPEPGISPSPVKSLPELPLEVPPELKEQGEEAPPELPQVLLQGQKSQKSKKLWTVLAAATLFAVALVFIFLSQKPEPLPDLKGLSLTQSEYLKNISQVRLREGVKIGLVGLAKDHRIFMASNREGPAVVTLSLTSIPKRVMGKETISFTSEAKLEGHFIVFDQFKFLSGTQFVPGYYKVQLQGISFHPQRKLINQLIRWGILSKEGYAEKFVFNGEILIADVLPSRFQEELDSYVTKLQEEATLPYTDLKERYGTLLAFTDQLLEYYQKTIEGSAEGFDKAAFEKGYASELGHLFQVFVEDTQKLKGDYLAKWPNLSSEFESLEAISLEVGALVGEMLDKTLKKASSKKKKLKEKARKELNDYFSQRSNEIKTSLKNRQDALEEKISLLKKASF